MTNEYILETALRQSAEDIGCAAGDFLKTENVVVPFRLGADARKYYKLPIAANLVSYGSNVVKVARTVQERVLAAVQATTGLDKVEVNVHVTGIAFET